jgi:hypothetical protein
VNVIFIPCCRSEIFEYFQVFEGLIIIQLRLYYDFQGAACPVGPQGEGSHKYLISRCLKGNLIHTDSQYLGVRGKQVLEV